MRKYYIDNLRWLTILLLIPYHAAMAWNVWGEPNYIFYGGSQVISSIVVFFSPYFMPLMFLIAGISARSALQKRTIGQYILERTRKLLVPFISGTMLIMPLMTYIADRFNYGYQGGLLQHYTVFFTRFTDLTGSDGGFSVGQFWFLLYLFVISLITAGIALLQRKIISGKDASIPSALFFVWGLPLPFLSGLLSVGGKSFAEYTYICLAGYFLFSKKEVADKAEQYKWISLCIGLMASVCNVYLFIWSNTQHTLPNMAAKYVSEWLMINSLIGIVKRYLNFSGKGLKYMSQRSYAFYIFHFIWLVLFQIFCLISAAAILFCCICCQCCWHMGQHWHAVRSASWYPLLSCTRESECAIPDHLYKHLHYGIY